MTLSSLGKYIPGKIWSFLAFYNLGKKMGLSLSYLSSTFFINLGLAIATALCLSSLRTMDDQVAWISAFIIYVLFFFTIDPFFKDKPIPVIPEQTMDHTKDNQSFMVGPVAHCFHSRMGLSRACINRASRPGSYLSIT